MSQEHQAHKEELEVLDLEVQQDLLVALAIQAPGDFRVAMVPRETVDLMDHEELLEMMDLLDRKDHKELEGCKGLLDLRENLER